MRTIAERSRAPDHLRGTPQTARQTPKHRCDHALLAAVSIAATAVGW
jgi:hypothetical protein